ncbi:hypothetical protein GCM10027299_22010 [Larkinella ripae]
METDSINYRDLLMKYMANVGRLEGTYFVGQCRSESMYDCIVFTEAEVEELRKLSKLSEELN